MSDKKQLTSNISAEVLESFPPHCNPFSYDEFHMGKEIGTNLTIMFANHSNKRCSYIILVNTETGERVQINFDKETTESSVQKDFSDDIEKSSGINLIEQ